MNGRPFKLCAYWIFPHYIIKFSIKENGCNVLYKKRSLRSFFIHYWSLCIQLFFMYLSWLLRQWTRNLEDRDSSLKYEKLQLNSLSIGNSDIAVVIQHFDYLTLYLLDRLHREEFVCKTLGIPGLLTKFQLTSYWKKKDGEETTGNSRNKSNWKLSLIKNQEKWNGKCRYTNENSLEHEVKY